MTVIHDHKMTVYENSYFNNNFRLIYCFTIYFNLIVFDKDELLQNEFYQYLFAQSHALISLSSLKILYISIRVKQNLESIILQRNENQNRMKNLCNHLCKLETIQDQVQNLVVVPTSYMQCV